VLALVLTLAVALALPPEPAALDDLNVPFLPPTEALCGGAAAAMVFRYWGDRHADVQQFAPLVDTRAGGIDTGALAGAVRARGWLATEIQGSLEAIRTNLEDQAPLILLIEDRPSRYHYVVAVGFDDRQVLVHDPTWGPSRPIAVDRLMRAWAATGFWALSVRPGPSTPRRSAATAVPSSSDDGSRPLTPCERLLEDAVAEITPGRLR
jgi:ABC-type bacteriocin/lantibiotic exporter with double-glycine peptidase domain